MLLLEKAIDNFRKNRIKLSYFENINDIFSYINLFMKKDMVIGVGDSVTFEEIGLYDYLRSGEFKFLDKYDKTLSKEEKRELYLKNFNSDIFFSGINALSYDGKIYNLDGNGSRVAPIIYGPKKVFLICGINKLVENEEKAMERIKNIAAPLDAIRLGKNTPCAKLGKCVDCKSPDKICNYMTIIQGQFIPERIEILILGEKLGY